MTDSNQSTRRSVLKQVGTGIALVGFSGAASARRGRQTGNSNESSGEDRQSLRPASGGSSVDVGGDNIQSPEEMREFSRQKEREEEAVSAQHIIPTAENGDGVSAQQQSAYQQNVDLIGGWNTDYSIETGYGLVYARIENSMTLFRANESDDDGNWHYFAWLWSKAEPADKPINYGNWPYSWFKSNVDLNDYNWYLENFKPRSRIDRHNSPISVGINVGLPSGASAGINGSFEISEGSVHPQNVSTGSSGQCGIRFDADGAFCRSLNAINGVIWMSSPDYHATYSDIPNDIFNWSVDGHTDGL